jgi:hypothetical protein
LGLAPDDAVGIQVGGDDAHGDPGLGIAEPYGPAVARKADELSSFHKPPDPCAASSRPRSSNRNPTPI